MPNQFELSSSHRPAELPQGGYACAAHLTDRSATGSGAACPIWPSNGYARPQARWTRQMRIHFSRAINELPPARVGSHDVGDAAPGASLTSAPSLLPQDVSKYAEEPGMRRRRQFADHAFAEGEDHLRRRFSPTGGHAIPHHGGHLPARAGRFHEEDPGDGLGYADPRTPGNRRPACERRSIGAQRDDRGGLYLLAPQGRSERSADIERRPK